MAENDNGKKDKRPRRKPEEIAKELREKEDQLIKDGEQGAKEEADLEKKLKEINEQLRTAKAKKKAGREAAARRAYVNGYERLLKKFRKDKDFEEAYTESAFKTIEDKIFDRINVLIRSENKLREVLPDYFKKDNNNNSANPTDPAKTVNNNVAGSVAPAQNQ